MRNLLASFAAAALLVGGLAAPVAAQRDRGEGRGAGALSDQMSARQEMQAGRSMSSREIERRVVPQMRDKGDYLGFQYDGTASAYRLKFIKEGQVTWVDVDARTGRILRIAK
jgi:uncharacterized membrane protein YkoI